MGPNLWKTSSASVLDIAKRRHNDKPDWTPSLRRLHLRELLPTNHTLQREVANDFKSGASMDSLARQWGVCVLVIEDVIRQVMRRQKP